MAETIKHELAERGRRTVVAAGAVARGDPGKSGADSIVSTARAFVAHERNICSTEAALAELGMALLDSDSTLVHVSQLLGKLPSVRSGLLASLELAHANAAAPRAVAAAVDTGSASAAGVPRVASSDVVPASSPRVSSS
jgi:hypothetical protein